MSSDKPRVAIIGHCSGRDKAIASALAHCGLDVVAIERQEPMPLELKILAIDELKEFPAEAYHRRKGKGERKRNRANRYR